MDSQDRVVEGDEGRGAGRVRVCLQDGVESGQVQSMSWTMEPGQSFQLRIRLDTHELDRRSVATQVDDGGGRDMATQTEERGTKRTRPVEGVQGSSSERKGCVEAELPVDGLAEEAADGECVPVLTGAQRVGHKWSSVLGESAVIPIEDSQLPE